MISIMLENAKEGYLDKNFRIYIYTYLFYDKFIIMCVFLIIMINLVYFIFNSYKLGKILKYNITIS